MSRPPVVVLKGADDILRGKARTDRVAELVGDADRAMCVEEVVLEASSNGKATEEARQEAIRALVDAAQTPPFFTDFRVVVGIGMELLLKDEHAALVAYLADPLPSTTLVLDFGGTSGKAPKAVEDAVKGAGGESVPTGAGAPRQRADFVTAQAKDAGVVLDRGATQLLVDWLGEDAGKLPGVLAVLASTYGQGTRLGAADVEPFLGDAGGVPPWDLTDAIDRGDIAGALVALRRLLQARHPMQVMATLHTHFQRILRLEGAAVRGEKEAATLLRLKGSTFPAKKALTQSNRLGHDRVVASIRLLADADLQLRGTIAWPSELAMEVLVARLARLAKTAR